MPKSNIILQGLKINPNDPFRLEFITSGKVTKDELSKLVSYFLACLTIPESDLWVNLSPYEPGRIIPASLQPTELGKDMLAQDYLLKQLSAGLTHPDTLQGKKYWDEIRTTPLETSSMAQLRQRPFLTGQAI